MKDYWDDRFFAWLSDARLEVGSSCCLSLCWEPGSLPWGPLFHAHGSTCLGLWLRPARAYIPAPALSWETGRSWLIHSQRAVNLPESLVHPFPETIMFCPHYRLTQFPPTSVLLSCALKFLCVHLLIWTSYSVPKLYVLKTITHAPYPVPMQLSPHILNPGLFIWVCNPWNLIFRNQSFLAWTSQ